MVFKYMPSKRKKVEKTSERMPSKLLDGIWRSKRRYTLTEHHTEAVGEAATL